MFTCLTADWFVADVLAAAVACCDCCWEELPAAVAAAAVVVADAEPAAPDEPPELAADCDGGVGGAGAAASFLGLWGPAVSCGVLEGSTRTMIAILVPFWKVEARNEGSPSVMAFEGRFARRLCIPRLAALGSAADAPRAEPKIC